MRARIELVIFDCDGVLVDSEHTGNAVLCSVVNELGWALSLEETLARFKGRAMPDIWAEVAGHLGIDIGAEIDAGFRARQLAALADEVEAVDGVHEALASLSVPYCVASNGPPEKMRVTLGATGLLPLFEGRLFSRVEVTRGKPHPDLFLHAARSLRAAPERCLVVEDSPLGIEAARRAGMRHVGFAGTATADRAALRHAGAEAVLGHLRELAAVLDG